tara:strand:+ start:125 stop:379 length:255 start_codon:yes stop_codon:yes gene_type:complete
MTKAKKSTKKPAPAELPAPEDREFGPVHHRCRCDRDRAIEMITAHGYRVDADQGASVIVEGDREAFDRWSAANEPGRNAGDGDS